MRLPLVALAVPSVLLGLLGLSRDWLPAWLGRTVLPDLSGVPVAAAPQSLTRTLVTSLLSTVLAGVGGLVAYVRWRSARKPAADRPAHGSSLLADGYYLDDVYELLVVRPVRALAGSVTAFDTTVVAGAVRGTGHTSQRLGATIRRLQDGDVQRYLTVLLAGAVVVAVAAWTTVAR